jgi:hypothetical protein
LDRPREEPEHPGPRLQLCRLVKRDYLLEIIALAHGCRFYRATCATSFSAYKSLLWKTISHSSCNSSAISFQEITSLRRDRFVYFFCITSGKSSEAEKPQKLSWGFKLSERNYSLGGAAGAGVAAGAAVVPAGGAGAVCDGCVGTGPTML